MTNLDTVSKQFRRSGPLGLGRDDGAGVIATSPFEHVDDAADERTFCAFAAPHWSTVLQVSFLNAYTPAAMLTAFPHPAHQS